MSAIRQRMCSCGRSLIAVWLLLASAGCEQPSIEQVETTAPVPVEVETARISSLRSTVAATGVVVAGANAEMVVVAPAQARIGAITHIEGDRVAKGEVLVRFDMPALTADVSAGEARISQATARVAATQANVERLSALLKDGVAARREVEDATRQYAEAQADLAQARSGMTSAQAMSDRAVVRALFAGVIVNRFHNPGDLVEAAAGDPVLRVIDPSRLEVMASVPAADWSRIVVGRTAQIRVPSGASVDATVATKIPKLDPANAMGNVRLRLGNPSAAALGMTVAVEIVSEERSDVLTIPTAALVDEDGDLFVMVAGSDGLAHRFPVAVGLSAGPLCEVTSGIKAGDQVVVAGQDGLPEGAAIRVQR